MFLGTSFDSSSVAYADTADKDTKVTVDKYIIIVPKGADIPIGTTPIEVKADVKEWGKDSQETWYVVSGDVTISERITVKGDVNLILADDCKLDAQAGITVSDGNGLTIYGCEKGNGKLIATSTNNQNAAIGGRGAYSDAGKITINGGVVTANADSGSTAAAIGGGDDASGGKITINGGDVTAINKQGNSNGAAIGGGQCNSNTIRSGGVIKINGGKVTASAFNGAAIGGGAPESGAEEKISGGEITINGGIIEATSDNGDGIGYGAGSTGDDRGTLKSDTDGSAWIVASSIEAKTNDFKVGVIFDTTNNGGNGKVYGNMIISGDVEIPAQKTLTVPKGMSLTIPASAKMAMLDSGKLTIEQGATLTIEGASGEEADDAAILDAAKGEIVNNGEIVIKGKLDLADETGKESGKIENYGTIVIENKGEMAAAGDSIDNKGKIINDGTVNMPADTTANAIKALNMTGEGKVMAGEKEYSNDGEPIGGGGGGGGGDSSQPQAGAGASTINLGPAGGSIDQILASVGVVRSENIRSASDFTDAMLNDSEDSLDTTTNKTDENQQIDATEQALKETQTEQGSSTGQATGTEQENAPKTRFERVTHRLFGYTVKHPSELTFIQRILLALYFFW